MVMRSTFRIWTARSVVVIALQAVAAFAQTPTPALLVLNKGANEMAIVDPSAMKVVGHVAAWVKARTRSLPTASWPSLPIMARIRRATQFQ